MALCTIAVGQKTQFTNLGKAMYTSKTQTLLEKQDKAHPIDNRTVALFEGFENGNSVAEPVNGWTQTSDPGEFWASKGNMSYNRQPRTGEWYAYLRYNKNEWMFKELTLEAGRNYTLSTWYITDGGSGTSLEIAYGTEASIAGMTNNLIPLTSVANTEYQEASATFTPATSGTYYLGIHGILTGSSNWYLTLDDVSVYSVNSYDAGITQITSPTNQLPTGNHPITVTLKNFGLETLTAVDINYTVNDENTVYAWTGSIETNETEEVILTNYEFATAGAYDVTASTNLTTDEDATNDSATININILEPITPPYFEGFESGNFSEEWTMTTTNLTGYGWETVSFSPSYEGDYSARFYTWMAAGTESILRSPFVNIGADESIELVFYYNYHYNGTDDENLHGAELYLNILDQNETIVNTSANLIENQQNNGWIKHTLQLDEYANQPFKFQFKAISDAGSYNISVDNVELRQILADDFAIHSIAHKYLNMATQDFMISATVENIGATAQTKTVELSINNITSNNQQVTLEPQESQEISFTLNITESNLYSYSMAVETDANNENNTVMSNGFVVKASQLSEDFEQALLPAFWNETGGWVFDTQEESELIEGFGALIAQMDGDDVAELTTPFVAINEWDKLYFRAMGINSNMGFGSSKLQVKYRSIDDQTWTNLGDIVDFAEVVSIVLFEYDLTTMVGQTIQFAFETTSDFSFSFEGIDYASAITIDDVVCDKIPMYNLKFTTLFNENPVEGVNIDIFNQTVVTDTNGEITLEAATGTFTYTAYLEGYKTTAGEVTINQEDATEIINLESEVSIDTPDFNDITVYPNPFNDFIQINHHNAIKQYSITNIFGQQIVNAKTNGNKWINTTNLSGGIYFVTLTSNNNQSKTYKIVKQ